MNRLKPLVKRFILGMFAIIPERLVSSLLPKSERYTVESITPPMTPGPKDTRLFIGPANMAGQGWQWARAAERHLAHVSAISMSAGADGNFAFPVDERVPANVYRWSPTWKRAQKRALLGSYTHVLFEFGRPLLGDPFGRSWLEDIATVRAHGISAGAVFHGSDIRLPSRHAAGSQWSPFRQDLAGLTSLLEHRVRKTASELEKLDLPVFVSTPDLLIDVPQAQWLPVVVDGARWGADTVPFSRDELPVVVHAPSKAAVKGSDTVDAVLKRLSDAGLLRYRRIAGVASSEMVEIYADADIVIDQMALGSYGVAACEAMAAGRVVVSHVSEQVRTHVQYVSGLSLPIIEANRETLEDVILAIIRRPDVQQEQAAEGVRFVQRVHSGAMSAAALESFLSTPGR